MTHHLIADAPRPVDAAPAPLLRLALRENTAFSALTGVFLVAFASRIDRWVGLDAPLLIGGGAALVAYAAMLWWGGRGGTELLAQTGRAAVAADLSWVVGAVVVVSATDLLTAKGEVALLLLSVPVAVLAIVQAVGLRRLASR